MRNLSDTGNLGPLTRSPYGETGMGAARPHAGLHFSHSPSHLQVTGGRLSGEKTAEPVGP